MSDDMLKLADQLERLKAAIRDAESVLFRATLYKGYGEGPLNEPFSRKTLYELQDLKQSWDDHA